ncbi:MAG TPA: hypothetical protein VN540_10175, partial [Clostridia bacterium]|nr:hypothetical protein [Clostridia bacterium]
INPFGCDNKRALSRAARGNKWKREIGRFVPAGRFDARDGRCYNKGDASGSLWHIGFFRRRVWNNFTHGKQPRAQRLGVDGPKFDPKGCSFQLIGIIIYIVINLTK